MKSVANDNQNIPKFRAVIIDHLDTIDGRDAISVRALVNSYNLTLNKSRKMAEQIIQLDIIRHIMIVTKPGEQKLNDYTREVVTWLMESYHQIHVYIDCNCKSNQYEIMIAEHEEYKCRFHFWNGNDPKLENIDLIITLGGDGTILFSSWMFQHDIPPLLSFHLGSLGFLTAFDFNDHRRVLRNIIEKGDKITITKSAVKFKKIKKILKVFKC